MDEAASWSSSGSACRSSSARRTSSAAAAPASPPRRRSSSTCAANGLAASPISEILIEQSIAGWKEYELEVMRDRADNCVIICSIENVDPMGVHTGDSITVAPAQTLTDVEYQQMRDAAFACIRRVGVETGGSNVQFAVNPATGEQVVIEMNPRVSRSSALASKATGFPIAKIAAKLAVGYTLDEIPNDITKMTPASFEPSIDYVVTKIPRWAFEKLPGTTGVLGTQMQTVGEAMAIGRTFPESLQKGLRSLEQGRLGLGCDPAEAQLVALSRRRAAGRRRRRRHPIASSRSASCCAAASRSTGSTMPRKIDPWFLDQMAMIVEERAALASLGLAGMDRRGVASRQAARLQRRAARVPVGRRRARSFAPLARPPACIPTYKTVDTCAAEFAAETPYHYTTYEDENEVRPSDRPRVVILGSGPNRIGQGIEFDYCCVHASFALREAGFETVMVNCNPETVSTDYDTSDRLYFEPLTREDVLNVIAAETAASGGVAPKVIVSLGGQTPLKLSGLLPVQLIAGTSPASIDLAEDREKWNALCDELRIPQPPGGTAIDLEQALQIVDQVGFPVLVRPSYVLGGRAMQIVHDRNHLARAMAELAGFGSLGKEGGLSAERPVLIDRFLEDATEVDVDAIRDHTGEVLIGGVMEHVEEAGVHSGDSACAIPPQTLPTWVVEVIESYTRSIANALDVRGLINVQYAVSGTTVYVIEANPRASRTVPFVAKATGVPLAKVATRVMLGATLAELRAEGLLRASVRPRPRRGEGGRAAVQPVPRGRHGARPGDALDRRGDGHRRHVRQGVLQGRAGRRHAAADGGHGVPVARRRRQAGRPRGRQAAARARPRHRRHDRHRGLPRPLRPARRPRRRQGQRGRRADRRRPDRRRQGQLRHQHARRAAADAPTASRSARRPTATGSARSPRSRPRSPRCRAWPSRPATDLTVRSLQEYHT